MNTYLTIGVARIQGYLTRSKRLRARSRASMSIEYLSRRYSADNEQPQPALGELLDGAVDGWCFNDELGKVDGVVSLVHPGMPPDPEVKQAAERALRRLRIAWPGADLSAVWGGGASYADAYRDRIGPALARNDVLFTPPPAPEVPLVRPCQLCEHDAAVERSQVVGTELELCVDCLSRRVRHGGGPAGGRATMAEELAGYGDPEEGNQLGTVYLDGNGIGALFESLATAGPDIRHRLSQVLSGAVDEALELASAEVRDEGEPGSPHLAHVSGGDDLLVSVPAAAAWRFTRRLLTHFRQTILTGVGRIVGADPQDPAAVLGGLSTMTGHHVDQLPSACAGLVVHHHTYPFALVVEAAQARLSEAKQFVGGAASAVAWTDLTIDGDRPPAWRTPWPLDELEQADPRLSALAGMPNSARYAAARLIDPEQPGTSWCRLAVHVQRFGEQDPVRTALRPFLDDGRSANNPAAPMSRLLDALTIARWW